MGYFCKGLDYRETNPLLIVDELSQMVKCPGVTKLSKGYDRGIADIGVCIVEPFDQCIQALCAAYTSENIQNKQANGIGRVLCNGMEDIEAVFSDLTQDVDRHVSYCRHIMVQKRDHLINRVPSAEHDYRILGRIPHAVIGVLEQGLEPVKGLLSTETGEQGRCFAPQRGII